MKRRRETSCGYTLIELLLYLACAGMIMSVPLMIAMGVVRGHQATTVQTAAAGEARNILDALGWDIRHATRVSYGSGGLPALRVKRGEETWDVVYHLEAEEQRSAGREASDATLQTYALVRSTSSVSRGTPVQERVIGRNLTEIEFTPHGKNTTPTIRCRVKVGDISDGRWFLAERESLFMIRQAETLTGEVRRQ